MKTPARPLLWLVAAAVAISLETLHGVVQLSGFATSRIERALAGKMARETHGVEDVRNSIIVRS